MGRRSVVFAYGSDLAFIAPGRRGIASMSISPQLWRTTTNDGAGGIPRPGFYSPAGSHRGGLILILDAAGSLAISAIHVDQPDPPIRPSRAVTPSLPVARVPRLDDDIQLLDKFFQQADISFTRRVMEGNTQKYC